jgi:hypothetical protein
MGKKKINKMSLIGVMEKFVNILQKMDKEDAEEYKEIGETKNGNIKYSLGVHFIDSKKKKRI